MLRFLFPRLTKQPDRGQALFDRAVAEARRPHWYVDGGVPDTIDGRFAMLATICALTTVRLESGDERLTALSPALTERFIEAMDAEHRQLGLNDPTLGKRVRSLVASLARRVDDWRAAVSGQADWTATARSSVYRGGDISGEQLDASSASLREFWQRLTAADGPDLVEGRF